VAGDAGEALNLFIRGVLQPGFYCNGKIRGSQFPSRRLEPD
jgi:hypothetical protein